MSQSKILYSNTEKLNYTAISGQGISKHANPRRGSVGYGKFVCSCCLDLGHISLSLLHCHVAWQYVHNSCSSKICHPIALSWPPGGTWISRWLLCYLLCLLSSWENKLGHFELKKNMVFICPDFQENYLISSSMPRHISFKVISTLSENNFRRYFAGHTKRYRSKLL